MGIRIRTRAVSAAEQRVADAGYPYVTTNTLDPNFHLGSHKHHSNNTHLVIDGSMNAWETAKGESSSVLAKNGEWVNMGKDVPYEIRTGSDGCKFAEGHTVLSPTTEQRIQGNGGDAKPIYKAKK